MKQGLKLIPLPMAHHPRIHAAWASSVSYHAYVWLKEHQHEFDIVHFPECQGLGFYSLLAKRQGLAFGDTIFVISPHFSPMMNRRRKRALTRVRIGDCANNPNG
jgi:hypothetical protein